jgi:ubiquinone/menaquinone biosynthesis C-methylase UbiE
MTEAERQIEAWRSVAAGWERQRPLVWKATRPVSERLVELLDPRPGESILEVAAGPGDTGFLAARALGPGGRLVSTDAAPEMVEAARRRAAELGLGEPAVSFAVENMARLSFETASFDGVLSRWGLMLVPDLEGAAREIARVTRPGGRVAVAVWAHPDENDWMTAPGRAALELGLLEPPPPDAPGPFRLSEDGRVVRLLERAGLAVETVEDVSITWHAPSLEAWWDVARDTSRMLTVILEQASDGEASAMRARAERRLGRYLEPDGSLAVPGLARVTLARRPE